MALLVKDVMRHEVWTVNRNVSIEDVRKLMAAHQLHMVVIAEDGKLFGVVTRADMLKNIKPESPIEKLMNIDVKFINQNQTIQEAAKIMTDFNISHLPVLNDKNKLVGIIGTEDIVKDFVHEEEKTGLSLEILSIQLAMTKNRELEEYWIKKAKEHGFKAVITQVGAPAEKLAIKLRESAIVAAIAKGVISEDTKEKIAVSNAVRDIFSQLNLINPGLGGGFKVAVVRGKDRVVVTAFGRCGHALANGPEQIVIGFSII